MKVICQIIVSLSLPLVLGVWSGETAYAAPAQTSDMRQLCERDTQYGWSEDFYTLEGYVGSEFSHAAQFCQYGNDRAALQELQKVRPVTRKGIAEWHYIRGLCFQGLGRFRESEAEYLAAQKSDDKVIVAKAKIGQTLAAQKDRKISRKQMQFPGQTSFPMWDPASG